MDIYFGKDGQVLGPYREEEIQVRLNEGILDGSELAWHEGLDEWVNVKEILKREATPEEAVEIESADLRSEIQLRPRIVFTRSKVQEDVQRIIDLYRLSGRFAAEVEPKVIQLDQNRIDLVFEIDEGSLSRIRKISFIGNHIFYAIIIKFTAVLDPISHISAVRTSYPSSFLHSINLFLK